MKKEKLMLGIGIIFTILLIIPIVKADIDSNMYAFYEFDNDYTDMKGNMDLTNTGTGNSFETYAKNGTHALFMDGNGWAKKTTQGFLTGNNDYTVICWINVSSIPSRRGIFWVGTETSQQGNFFAITNSSGIKLELGQYGTETDTSSAFTPRLDDWVRVGVTYDGATKASNFYVNGTATGSASFVGNNNINSAEAQFGTAHADSSPFVGGIDDCILYNRELSGTDMLQDYNSYLTTPANFTVTATNIYDGTAIQNFSLDLNGTTYYTDTGEIFTQLLVNNTYAHNMTFYNMTGYYNQTYTDVNLTVNNSIEGETYQAILVMGAYEKITNDSITGYFNASQQNSTGTIYVNNGTIEVTYDDANYYSKTDTVTVTGLTTNYHNISNIYNNKLTIYYNSTYTDANITNVTTKLSAQTEIYEETLTANGDTVTFNITNGLNYSLLSTRVVYQNLTSNITVTGLTQTEKLTLSPISLWLIASENTNISVTTSDNTTETVNDTTVYIEQNSLPIGKVTVRWNDAQLFEYYNDQLTPILEYIYVFEEYVNDTTQIANRAIIVTGDGSIIENARVKIETYKSEKWQTVYGRLTNENGQANLYLKGNEDYKLTVTANGFYPSQEVYSVVSGDTATKYVDLTRSTSSSNDLLLTNCDRTIIKSTLCSFEVVCGSQCINVKVIKKTYYNNGTIDTNQTTTITSTGINYTEVYDPENVLNISNITNEFYIDGTTLGNITTLLVSLSNRNMADPFTTARINQSDSSAVIWIIFIVLIGTIIAGLSDSKILKGSGIYAFAMWLALWSIKIPILLIFVLIIAMFKVGINLYTKVRKV